ncbi:MAG: c-type cytochrome [Candidatus Krumholzibacteriia bacterium]
MKSWIVNRRKAVRVGIGLLLFTAVAAWGGFTFVSRPRLTPALRGQEVARRLGCAACHGPGGTGGIPNPGSKEKEIPAWDGGVSMMYVESEEEIREWILDGHPKRLQRREGQEPETAHDGTSHSHGSDADLAESGELSPPLKMPAFRGLVSKRELEDLVAYYKAIAAFDSPPPVALEGYLIASRLGCFGCHGPAGRLGAKNPRSFKGYIPPWQGKDFAELVKDDGELRQWILRGQIDRFESNPLARYFTRRQIIRMPAYESVIEDRELRALMEYIAWLQL